MATIPAYTSLHAEVTLAPIFTDHMVLQCELPVHIWGTADPGEEVTVSFANQSKSITAGHDGHWTVSLDPLKTASKGRPLTVEAANTITLEDVLVGEVWFCSGQSNMEKPLGKKKGQKPVDNFEKEFENAQYPNIRMYQMPHYGKVDNAEFQKRWLPCSPESLEKSRFSAVGYFFGREIHESLDIPIGIIHASFGGTMIETWMPERAFTSDPVLHPLLFREYHAWVDGVQPTDLYQSMVEPLVPYTLRGFLWYQGESNLMYAESDIYARKMRALINDWRRVWNRPDAPFYYVQLAPFEYSEWDKFPRQLTPEALPLFWEVQERLRVLSNTGMVVTTDLAGDASDIHPTRKQPVGKRLAMLALKFDYQKFNSGEAMQSPVFKRAVYKKEQVQLFFDFTGGSLKTRDGNAPDFFEIAGPDNVFHPAKVTIENDSLIAESPEVSHPIAIRFAWDEKANPNLVNAAGLPVSPFRTDKWPVQNEK